MQSYRTTFHTVLHSLPYSVPYHTQLFPFIAKLASVSITTLDLIGQQTETVQIYVNSVLQFYRLTEALFRRAPLLPDASRGGTSASAPSAIFVTHTTALAIPLHLFVDILALHFLQVVQWFLTVGSLGEQCLIDH